MTARSGYRARTVEQLFALGAGFMSAEGRALGLAFKPVASDVIIATYPKCGTTWMQQILHGLRSAGAMDFDEITEVVPWLELMGDLGLDPDSPQVATPRLFKSHLSWRDVPKGARYLNAIRDPGDVLMSLYRFFDGWRMERGAIDLRDFALQYFIHRKDSARYWNHILSWWQQRDRDDVLLLCYEDMLDDAHDAVARIARFADLPDSGAVFDIALRQSGFAFMKAHERQFDDHLVRAARDQACGLPPAGHSSKVMTGTAGQGREALDDDVLEAMHEQWREIITPATGLQDYNEMRCALAEQQGATR